MVEELLMPKLGMAQSYCIIERWLKKPGDKVAIGDVLVEVSTDKITYEVESKTDGYLLEILNQEGEEVPAKEVIAYIGQQGEEIPVKSNGIRKNAEGNSQSVPILDAGDKSISDAGYGEKGILISPLAKKIISDNNLDAGKIKGSGPGGRIMKEDVITFMEKNPTAGQTEQENFYPGSGKDSPEVLKSLKLEGIRKIISEKMTYSKQNIPHISQSVNVDVTEMVIFKEKTAKISEIKITYSDILLKAVSLALKENPEMNSSYINGQHIIYRDINPGLVVSIDNGLIIPVFKNCDRLSIEEISLKRNELIKRAREGNLSAESISGGTFTITNLGMLNIRSCTAIIYPPQAAILSTGGIFASLEVLHNGETSIRKIMDVTVTEDHRVLDGAAGAKFLISLKEILEKPEKLSN